MYDYESAANFLEVDEERTDNEEEQLLKDIVLGGKHRVDNALSYIQKEYQLFTSFYQ